MPRGKLYGDDPTTITSVRCRAVTKDLVTDLAGQRGHAVSQLVSDLLELYVARNVDGFEPRLLLSDPDAQPVLVDFDNLAA